MGNQQQAGYVSSFIIKKKGKATPDAKIDIIVLFITARNEKLAEQSLRFVDDPATQHVINLFKEFFKM